MRIVELDSGQDVREELQRKGATSAEAIEVATRIIADVKERGDEALLQLTKEFDEVELKAIRLSQDEINRAVRLVPRPTIEALQAAAANIKDFHERQVQQSWFVTRPDGALMGSRITPLESVGIYVPGGRAVYPSTVLMNAIPAQVAGVRRIAMVTPPQKSGGVNPVVLAAAQIAKITDIYMVGGAQAIAALAYGTEQIKPVDKITGPGNEYVAAAKRLVYGDVGIDMIAGPSEVLILADETADPAMVAIDLLAQAEHDPSASTYLVALDEEFVDEVIAEIEGYLAQSPRQELTKQAIDDNCLVLLCPNLSTAIQAVNTIAPKHLEIHMDSPMELLGLIENAGAIFLGPWTPESVGDYFAGPNHTLPTGGTARFASPLSVDDFVKRTNVISYSYVALQKDAKSIRTLADAESLWAHGKAVDVRFETRDEDDTE
jgi:histidinol dehydrogenase